MSYIQTYSVSIVFTLLYYLLLFLLIFSFGCLKNDKLIYKKNVILYFVSYVLFLIVFTMLLGRTGIGLIDREYFNYYIKKINLIPFKTIIGYVLSISNFKLFLYNIVGNLVALIPLSIIILLKDEKNKSIKKQFLFLSISSFMIEFFHLLYSAGSFDIDDYILNVFGPILFILLINKLNVTQKIINVFNSDFNIRHNMKLCIYILVFSLILLFSFILVYELIDNNYNGDNIVASEKIYLMENENCEGENGTEMSIEDAFKVGFITSDNFNEILLESSFTFDEERNVFFLLDSGLYAYECLNNIYFINNVDNIEYVCS